MGGAVESVGDFIQDEIIDPVKEVGRDVDDFVNEEIPGGWYTVGAVAGGTYLAAEQAAAAGASGSAGAAAGAAEVGAASTAVPGSLSAALPELGVATSGGYTALPGTLAAETAGLMGTGTALAAPISVATGVPAGEVAYPSVGVEQTYTPAPGSFQEALPGLGVETQASMAPFTAAPGSFQAATAGGLLTPAAATGFGIRDAVDALRIGNSVRKLLAQPEPQIPNMIGMNQVPRGAIDYSPTLNLLAQRPRRADIYSLLG